MDNQKVHESPRVDGRALWAVWPDATRALVKNHADDPHVVWPRALDGEEWSRAASQMRAAWSAWSSAVMSLGDCPATSDVGALRGFVSALRVLVRAVGRRADLEDGNQEDADSTWVSNLESEWWSDCYALPAWKRWCWLKDHQRYGTARYNERHREQQSTAEYKGRRRERSMLEAANKRRRDWIKRMREARTDARRAECVNAIDIIDLDILALRREVAQRRSPDQNERIGYARAEYAEFLDAAE
jgi:hypothetical protein